MMVRLLLLMFAALHGALALEVKIEYDPPVLAFTLPLFERGVGSVVFNYHINNMLLKGRGVKTSEGWQYRKGDVKLERSDIVYANAEVYDVNGNLRMSTGRSSLALGETRPVARLPSRRIRGATFFRDDFNSFNKNNWNYEVTMNGGYNGEFQVYTCDARNVYTNNGKLYIKPTTTVSDSRWDENFLHNGVLDMKAVCGYCTISDVEGCWRQGKDGMLPPIMSGKIKSVPTMKYGVVEVRARIPKGDWIWPAIWMMPRYDVYGGWPRSGELDIMEALGQDCEYGIGTVTSTLHWGPHYLENRFRMTHGEKKSASWFNSFHTWRLEWTHTHIVTFIDDQQIMYVDPGSGGFWQKGGFTGQNLWSNGGYLAPFDQDFYLILNVAVGGTSGMFPDPSFCGNKPWRNSDSQKVAAEKFWKDRNSWLPTWHGDDVALEVDYVEFRHL